MGVIDGWVSVVAETALWMWLLVRSFDGVRDFTANKLRGLALAKAALPLAIVITLTFAVFLTAQLASRYPPGAYEDPGPVSRERYANLPPDLAEKHTRVEARLRYALSGNLSEYFDQSRGWVLWQPTQEDTSLRDDAVLARALWGAAVSRQKLYAGVMALSILLVAFLGWRSVRKR